METLIYFVRHGQSLGNQQRIFLGHTDMDLTELGYRQAERTAERLAPVDFAAIYSSDLLRAYNTAMPHAERRGLTVNTDVRFREFYCGEWEGLSVDQLIEKYGELYTYSWVREFGIFRMPGGESTPEVADRMYAATLDAARQNEGKTILCASHAAAIRALFARVLGLAVEKIPDELPYPSNASYSILKYDGAELSVVSYSNDDHLAELFTTWKD